VIFTCSATCIATHFATCRTLLHGQSLELPTLYWALCTLPICMHYTYHKQNKWKHVKSTMKTFGRITLGIIKKKHKLFNKITSNSLWFQILMVISKNSKGNCKMDFNHYCAWFVHWKLEMNGRIWWY
jgi:hypothetical protein